MIENHLHQNHASPELCKQLCELGLTTRTAYKWKVRETSTLLYTPEFDVDGYYASIDKVLPPLHVVPAYSIKDIEKCLPPWLMTLNENGYEVSLEKIYNMKSCIAARMPDAFAMLLIEVIKKCYIDLTKVNRFLNARF